MCFPSRRYNVAPGIPAPYPVDSKVYLANLPDSEDAARDLLAWAGEH